MIYEQSFPAGSEAADTAQVWIRGVAAHINPALTEDAEHVIGAMVALSVRRAPDGATINVSATSTDHGMRLEVADPGVIPSQHDRGEWEAISAIAWDFGSTRADNGKGRRAWVELRPQALKA